MDAGPLPDRLNDRVALMRTLRLDLEYDGGGFVGWQSQAHGRTVQGELQRALCTLLQEEVVPIGSGRTDAGTHAAGQVAHLQTRCTRPVERILVGLNALLPPDVAVHRVVDAPVDFHARYSARGKRYRYRVATTRPALERHRVWPVYHPLDVQAMQAATAHLTGPLDFRAFCKANPEPEHYECRIDAASWTCVGDERHFEIAANRFLRHMVRILVGTLVDVGRGQLSAGDFGVLLQAGAQRHDGGPTAPARGLCLQRVFYDDGDGGPSGLPATGA